jgi:RNAse (barnase) inhibitor barstar
MVQMCTSNDTMNAVATQGFRLATENGGDASWDAAWELLNSVTGFWPLTLRWKEMLK